MKKIYYATILVVFFISGFLLSYFLFGKVKREINYSILKDMEKFNELLLNDVTEYKIIDLRKAEDFQKSHLTNSINIPYEEDTFIQELRKNELENVPIYLICYSGNMSSLAFNLLIKNGINNVHYIAFGYNEFLDYLMPENSAKYIEIAYQDIFPSLYLEEKGKSITTIYENFEYTLVAYISNECVSCKDALYEVSILNALKEDTFEIILLWKNEMPTALLESYNLYENSVALNNEVKLSDITPTYFLLNKEGRVVFIEKGNCNNVINKLFEMNIYSTEKNMSAALQYLNQYMVQDRENIFFFSTEDCYDCTEALLKLKERIEFREKNIINICNQREDISSQGNNIIDQYRIFGRIFNISGYPTIYLQSKSDGQFYLYKFE